jgi:Xaa-Pro dipeptidase
MEKTFPTLSLRERDRRWKRTRDLMAASAVDCLLLPGFKGREELDGYLSNDYAEGIVIFPLDAAPVHLGWTGTRVIRAFESAARGITPWIADMRAGTTGPGIVAVLKEKGFEKARIGVVGIESVAPGEPEGFFPYKTWAHVQKELPLATFIDLSAPFAEMMLVKSAEELIVMRYAAGIGEEACKRMFEMAAPGVTERQLYTAIVETLFSYGACPPAPFLILVSGLENLGWGPPIWHYQGGPSRTVAKGEQVQAEIFPRYSGLETQQQMSIHLGPPNDTILHLGKVARESYEAGCAALRPGNTFEAVCDAMTAPLVKAGCWHLTPLIHSLSPIAWTSGVAVGIEQAAGLDALKGRVRTRPVSGGNLVLRPGMVFELEPNPCRDKYRVNIGGTVVVTERGAEELNSLPTEMRIKG